MTTSILSNQLMSLDRRVKNERRKGTDIKILIASCTSNQKSQKVNEIYEML